MFGMDLDFFIETFDFRFSQKNVRDDKVEVKKTSEMIK